MKIIFSSVFHSAFNPKNDPGFERAIFFEELRAFNNGNVVHLPFERIFEVGKRKFNEEILERVKNEKPDIFFAYMFSDEFDPGMLEELKKYTTTVAWFSDDSWRFYNYSRRWAKHFNWVVTTYSYMPERYKKIGQPNVIRSQWAMSPRAFQMSPDAFTFSESERPDVTFVGGWSAPREAIIKKIKSAGVNIALYGSRWKDGRWATQEEIGSLFSHAKVNVGLNPPPGLFTANSLGRLFFRHSTNKIVPDLHIIQNIQSWLHRDVPQLKARHFEIPGCGGFMLTEMADDLGAFYEIDKEIVVYENRKDLLEKIRYYIDHPRERLEIAKRGYERTMRDHTYKNRFQKIFEIIGRA